MPADCGGRGSRPRDFPIRPATNHCSIMPPPRGAGISNSPPAARVASVAGALAQSVEHRTFNPQVVGSIPTRPIYINRLKQEDEVASIRRRFGATHRAALFDSGSQQPGLAGSGGRRVQSRCRGYWRDSDCHRYAALADCSAASSSASNSRPTRATCSSPNWLKSEDGRSYSKIAFPDSSSYSTTRRGA
jgi:hypothetical protein